MGSADPSGRLGPDLLTFRCGGRDFAIDIMAVRELRSWSRPTPLPHAPRYMLGVVNLRGSVLPVMDLACRLGTGPTPDAPRNVIIVIETGRHLIGLLVEAVSDIVHPTSGQLQDIPDNAGDVDGDLSDQILVTADRMIQILSTEGFLPARVETGADPEPA